MVTGTSSMISSTQDRPVAGRGEDLVQASVAAELAGAQSVPHDAHPVSPTVRGMSPYVEERSRSALRMLPSCDSRMDDVVEPGQAPSPRTQFCLRRRT